MESGLLVAGQTSALFPTPENGYQLIGHSTAVYNDQQKQEGIPEHAIHAAVLHTPATGTILLRVLHSGSVLELCSLSSNVPSLRFKFASPVCFSPALFLDSDVQIHILALTQSAVLHRVMIPVSSPTQLWTTHSGDFPWTEYVVRQLTNSAAVPFRGLVHVQGLDCVGIALPNGALLRLDMEDTGGWTENIFHPGSFLSSLSSLLPSMAYSSDDKNQIVSMATHAWPTDMSHIWTLSRDRTLRFWKARLGCVASKSIPLSTSFRELSPSKSPEPRTLLDPAPQTLLRVFSTGNEGSTEPCLYVMVYIPPSAPSISGGSFHIFSVVKETMLDIGRIDCPEREGHCHLQDFMILEDTVFALWDFQGQSLLDRMALDLSELSEETFRPTFWVSSRHPDCLELTPGYLEEQLLSPGAFAETYLEIILRPGVFSPLTLKTAIEQYTYIHASAPGEQPPQLLASYASVEENIAAVVGCTVKLNRDVHTGSYQFDNYWNALRRDWDGFVARCKEIERSARWPLVLGAQGAGDIIVVERERVGALVVEDHPILLHRAVSSGTPRDGPPNELITTLWTIREKLGPAMLSSLESHLVELLHQEVYFSFSDAMQELVRRTGFHENIDQGLASWVTGSLQAVRNLDAAIRATLDLVGALDVEVKMEEDEIELLLPNQQQQQSDWTTALAASYITTTAHARYDICLALMTILFFLSDELPGWDPNLIAEIFAVFRGVAIVRYVSMEPARFHSNSLPPTASVGGGADRSSPTADVTAQLGDLQVSLASQTKQPQSLLSRLLSQSPDPGTLPGSAHRFLDKTGLLQSVSPAYSTKDEVMFCEKLRMLGHYLHAREVLGWLPRSPPVVFVMGRVNIDLGRYDDAAELFEGLCPYFGPERAVSVEDQAAMISLLPRIDSHFAYYHFVTSLFSSAGAVQQHASFLAAALLEAPLEYDLSEEWRVLINLYIDLRRYDEAYTTLVRCPNEFIQQECIVTLVHRICEDGASQKLFVFNFGNKLTSQVEAALSFKARNADPRAQPCYAQILYSWYISQGKYRQAATIMYIQSQRLRTRRSGGGAQARESMEEQLEAYNITINCLCLLEGDENPSIVVPSFSERRQELQPSRKVTRYIPQSEYTVDHSRDELISLADIRHEHALLAAQIEVAGDDPSALLLDNPILAPRSLLSKLVGMNHYVSAFRTAWSLNLDMSEVFKALTRQCLHLPHRIVPSDLDPQLLAAESSLSGTSAERGWRYLRMSLDQYDGLNVDYKYRKAVFETFLDSSETPIPPWLLNPLQNYDHTFVIRAYLTRNRFSQAIEAVLAVLLKGKEATKVPPKNAGASCLPFSLAQQVVAAASMANPVPSNLSRLQTTLQDTIEAFQKVSIIR